MATQRSRVPKGWWPKSALAGLIGGAAMGLFLALVTASLGRGFWNPFNAIGATIVRSGIPHVLPGYYWPLQTPGGLPELTRFHPGLSLVGLILHLAVSALLGIVIGWAFVRFRQLPLERDSDGLLAGVVVGMAVWTTLGLLVGPALNRLMTVAPVPPSWMVGHVIFGLVTVMLLRAWLPAAPTVRVTFAPVEREIPIVREQRPS